MALLDGAAELGKGRHRRRRRNKEREKQLMLQAIREERDEARKQKREQIKQKRNKRSKELKMPSSYSDHSWRNQEPSFTHLAISFSLLKKDGAMEVVSRLREMYDKGKLQNLVFIADSADADEVENARKWLAENDSEWLFSHVVLNTSETETPSQFLYRVLKAFKIDAFIVDSEADISQTWVRSVLKSLRVFSFNNWPDSIAWTQKLNGKYYMTCEPDSTATRIIDTAKVQASQAVKDMRTIKPGAGWLD